MDRIATEGVRFSRCVTNSPVCIPTRRSIATGHYPHNTGIWRNQETTLDPEAPNWMRAVREAGYRTSLFGKTHLNHAGDDLRERAHLLTDAGHRRRLRDGGAAAVRHNAVTHDRRVGVTGHLGRLPARLRGALCQQATRGPAVPARASNTTTTPTSARRQRPTWRRTIAISPGAAGSASAAPTSPGIRPNPGSRTTIPNRCRPP